MIVVTVKINKPFARFKVQSFHLLGTVGNRSHKSGFRADPPLFSHHFAESKINKHVLLLSWAEHNIARLDVAVNEAEMVQDIELILQVGSRLVNTPNRCLAILQAKLDRFLEDDEIEAIDIDRCGGSSNC